MQQIQLLKITQKMIPVETRPLVSICIPTFNSAMHLEGAINSALGQTYRNIEVLVCDNASTDRTQLIVEKIAARDKRVCYFRHPENLGMVLNFNACIKRSSGKYIKFLCSDDEITANCVFEMVKAMERSPDVALVACSRFLVDHAMNMLGIGRYADSNILLEGDVAVKHCFFRGNIIGEPTAVMFRKCTALRGFNEKYLQLMDLEMWFYILQKGQFEYLPESLCRVRKHLNQATTFNLSSGVVLEDKRQLFRMFSEDFASSSSIVERSLWDIRMAITLKRTRDAGQLVKMSLIKEVYSPAIFSFLWCPIVYLTWPFICSVAK